MQTLKVLEYDYLYLEGSSDAKITIVLFHGTGGDENDLVPFATKIYPDAHVISVRGNVLENNYKRFFERYAEGIFNEDDIKKRAKDIADFCTEVKTIHNLEHTKFIALGYSNGANMIGGVLLLHLDIFDAAILFRGMLPLYPESTLDLKDVSVLMVNGSNDHMISHDKAIELAEILKQYGADVTHEWLPLAHQLSQNDIDIAEAWITNLNVND
jgi:predicted esterase